MNDTVPPAKLTLNDFFTEEGILELIKHSNEDGNATAQSRGDILYHPIGSVQSKFTNFMYLMYRKEGKELVGLELENLKELILGYFKTFTELFIAAYLNREEFDILINLQALIDILDLKKSSSIDFDEPISIGNSRLITSFRLAAKRKKQILEAPSEN